MDCHATVETVGVGVAKKEWLRGRALMDDIEGIRDDV